MASLVFCSLPNMGSNWTVKDLYGLGSGNHLPNSKGVLGDGGI